MNTTMKSLFRALYDSISSEQGGPLMTAYQHLVETSEGYSVSRATAMRLEELKDQFREAELKEFDVCWPNLLVEIEKEFATQLLGEAGSIRRFIGDDKAVLTARSLLVDEEALKAAMLTGGSY
jgi:hypothetical protein